MKEIKLTRNKVALVDDEDFDYLNQFKWCVRKRKNSTIYYAFRSKRIAGKKTVIHMHRVILGLEDPGIICDHKDHNGLNNQKYNLREANYSQNNSNRTSRKNSSSKYLGVSWNKQQGKWHAQIKKGLLRIHLGYFECEIEAAKAYNLKAAEIHGEYSNLNTGFENWYYKK
jgi:hypothetical protein